MNEKQIDGRWVIAGLAVAVGVTFLACQGAVPVEGTGANRTANGGAEAAGNGGGIFEGLRLDGGGLGAGDAVSRSGPLPTADAHCGAQKFGTTRGAANVLLVLDVSGSMTNTGISQSTRYQEVTRALDQALPATNDVINWGLMLFPARSTAGGRDTSGSNNCNPGVVSVPAAPNNAAAVAAGYQRVTPRGYTPTALTIDNAVAYLSSLNDGEPKYIVLATDGEPNCTARGAASSDAERAVAAVGHAAAAGIPVFVVGLSVVGNTSADRAAPGVLNQMAVAGGKPRSDPTNKFYMANTADEMVSVMDTIGTLVASCLFKLPEEPPVPTNVLVVYPDGTRALPGPTTWEYTDPTHRSIQILGESCDKVLDGTYPKIDILFGCPGEETLIP